MIQLMLSHSLAHVVNLTTLERSHHLLAAHKQHKASLYI